jgi:hypothetical protein
MLNIRKVKQEKAALLLVYGVLLGFLPHAVAGEEPQKVVQEVVVVNPLEKFKGAKELSEADLKELLEAVGFEGKALRTAWAVAMKESNGRPRAHNGDRSTGDNSYGIFQINMLGSLGDDRRDKFNLETNTDLFDPVTNAKIAFFMTAGGVDWSSWKVHPGGNNGERYEQFYALFPSI